MSSGAPLEGLRVLDLDGGIAAAYCTKLLADAGADVVFAEPPDGAASRSRWPAGLFDYLHASKRSVTPPRARQLASRAGIVVAGPDFHRLRRPPGRGRVVVTISPFGSSGPWRDRPATEFVLQAACGSTGSRGYPGEQPLAAGGSLGEWITGTYAAVGALAGWWRSTRTGAGCRLDVAMLDCMAVGLVTYPSVFAAFAAACDRPPMAAAIRKIEVPSVEPTTDGWVTFTTNSAQQFSDFCVLIGHPELAGDERYTQATARFAHRERFEAMVREYTRSRSSEAVLEEAGLFRIPVAPVLEGGAVLDFDHFTDRGVFVDNTSGGFRQPRRPYRIHGCDLPPLGPVPAPGEHDGQVEWAPLTDGVGADGAGNGATAGLPLEGLRVADMTAWWAGPYASQVLAFLGADVVKVESTTRPDLMRFASVKGPGEELWWEWGPLAHAANTNKRGITIDLTRPEGRDLARRAVRHVDVMVENYTPRVLDQFGLGWEQLRQANPGLILVRMPPFGLDGPWRDRPGFAQTMESLTGLAAATGWPDREPVLVGGAGDLIAGVHASFSALVALFARRKDGHGYLVESTMVESVLACAAAVPIEYQLTGMVRGRAGNRSRSGSVPQGVYRCAGEDEWLAIEVEDDAQWCGLCAVLGWPPPPFAAAGESPQRPATTHAARAELADAIDDWLVEAVGSWRAEDLADRLAEAGVPASVVIAPARLADNPQLAHRHLFEHEIHPVTGMHLLPGLPMSMSGVPAWVRRPSPLLGEHNEQFLADIGLTESERAELRARGIIGESLRGG